MLSKLKWLLKCEVVLNYLFGNEFDGNLKLEMYLEAY